MMQFRIALPLAAAALILAATAGTAQAVGPAPREQVEATVDGFEVQYAVTSTPEKDWGSASEEQWIVGFQGRLESERPLSYRGVQLPAGRHDVWVEKGSGEWFHLHVGDRDNEEAPRLRAIFKLYELEQGVESLKFELKLTRRGTKLKFSVQAGRSEGHGNFRIMETEPAPTPGQ